MIIIPARLKLIYNVGLSGRLIQNTLMRTLMFTTIEMIQKRISGGTPYKYNIPSTFPIWLDTFTLCVDSLIIVTFMDSIDTLVDSIDSSNTELLTIAMSGIDKFNVLYARRVVIVSLVCMMPL